jgi:tRNA U55 pseudouridine synthase TruB
LEQLGPDAVMPAHAVLPDLPRVELDATARNAITHGQAVVDDREAGRWGSGEAVALLSGNELVAIARTEGGWLRPTVVLESP